MDDKKYIVKTWEKIAEYTPFSSQTLQRVYGKDMLIKGYAFKHRIGYARTMTVWSYPELIKRYFILLGQKRMEE